MFSIIIVLFVLYFPVPQQPPPEDHEHHHHTIPSPSEILHSEYRPPTFHTAVSVATINFAYFVMGTVISIIFLSRNTHQARVWAAWLGVISMILAAAQYIPQLWVTWRIKVHQLPFQ
jgi:hypothetical protein